MRKRITSLVDARLKRAWDDQDHVIDLIFQLFFKLFALVATVLGAIFGNRRG